MKKVSKCFVDSKIFPIFVPAILEKASGNALFDILHDMLTSFDLVKSGKFEIVIIGFWQVYRNSIFFEKVHIIDC